IHLENVTGNISARNQRGTIEIDNPGAAVAVQNNGGSVVVKADQDVAGDYAIQCKEGNVVLMIPESSAVDVQGVVNRGKLRTDLPLSVTGTDGATQTISGKLNGGGANVAIDVSKGKFELHGLPEDILDDVPDDVPDDIPEPPEPPIPPVPPEPPIPPEASTKE
ncbi:MAG: hypothetical protein HN521_05425, partial [Candidatus Latescibacteria bacterium]|nr:hypothetical protein [Candidatus Latescibacterota bacterium]